MRLLSFEKAMHLAARLKKPKVIAALALLAAALCATYFFVVSPRQSSAEYLTDTVKRGNVTSAVSASGTVEPVTSVTLGFKNAEVITAIYVKVGDRVKKGQLLAEQASDNLEAEARQAQANVKNASARLSLLVNGARPEELEQARANLKAAEASFEVAKANLERYEKLYREGAIAQSEYDKCYADYVSAEAKLTSAKESLKALEAGNRAEDIEAARAQLESSEAQMLMAQNNLAGTKLVSPIDGIVSSLNGAVGQRATANNNNTTGGGFITIISEELQVKAQVNESDIGKVKEGQKAEFTVNSFPGQTFSGTVLSISPQAYTVSNVQIYDVYIALSQNYPELKAGMPANVSIIIDRRENVLTVPKGAVTFAQGQLAKNNQSGTARAESGSSRQQDARTGEKGGQGGDGQKRGQPSYVYVLDNSGKPSQRQVVLGLSDLRNYEVISGLNEGEVVITGLLNQVSNKTSSSQSGGLPFMGGPPAAGIRR